MQAIRIAALLAVMSTALLATPVNAVEAEIAEWGEVRGWAIGVDFTVGNGCFISTDFEDGTRFRLGFDNTNDAVFIVVGNPNWQSIEDGKEYDIKVRMDRASPWLATATGGRLDGLPVLVAYTTESNFVVEFMRKREIRVEYEGVEIANLSLRGSSAAIQEMVRCQDEMDANGPRQVSDPFAKGTNKSSDPFAR